MYQSLFLSYFIIYDEYGNYMRCDVVKAVAQKKN